jgi:putative FmdB family regulatory protein
MPIYAYRCATCGHAQDVLQKMSDDVLTVCPACHASTYVKQVTAAGFQLKGSGWYVTDFRGGNTGKPEPKKDDAAKTDAGAAATPSADAKTDTKAADKPASSPAPTPAAPAAAPPPSSGS